MEHISSNLKRGSTTSFWSLGVYLVKTTLRPTWHAHLVVGPVVSYQVESIVNGCEISRIFVLVQATDKRASDVPPIGAVTKGFPCVKGTGPPNLAK